MDIPYKSIPFIAFYNQVMGSVVKIENDKQKLSIYNSHNEIVGTVFYSKTIIHEFNFEDLIRSNSPDLKRVYYVYENGSEGKNWLWSYDVIPIPF